MKQQLKYRVAADLFQQVRDWFESERVNVVVRHHGDGHFLTVAGDEGLNMMAMLRWYHASERVR